MTDDPRVEQLLDELLDTRATPEEVCRRCPELLSEVRVQWREMCRVRAELDVLFPAPSALPQEGSKADIGAPGRACLDTSPLEDTDLPRIPGYEVEAVLGRGGMGVVYRARHLKLNRSVALKMLLAGAYAGRQELARFQREAEAIAGLRHPNIVRVYEVGELEGRPYFTMEFVEGGSLADRLAGVPQPARRAAELVATLADAVEFAHASRIIHRDLKPANILLTAPAAEARGTELGTPVITDFGVARRIDGPEFTVTGARIGTPSYMAPEQALGRVSAIGPAVDVYALGAILYEVLTGRPPFQAETAAETERQVITKEPVPPSRLNAKVPRDLETICLMCLHKAPARRYATAAALAEDLRRFQRGEPIAARPAGLVERTGKWVRRHPTGSAMLAASLLVAVALVAASFWLVVQQTRQRQAVE